MQGEDLEPILCDLMQHVLCHLDVHHFGRLQRTSKAIKKAAQQHKEWFLSKVRIVELYRTHKVYPGGKVHFVWIHSVFKFECEAAKPAEKARDIIAQIWELRKRARGLSAKRRTCWLFIRTGSAGVPTFLLDVYPVRYAEQTLSLLTNLSYNT